MQTCAWKQCLLKHFVHFAQQSNEVYPQEEEREKYQVLHSCWQHLPGVFGLLHGSLAAAAFAKKQKETQQATQEERRKENAANIAKY